MNKTIVFKTESFPSKSETFVLTSVLETIKKGYNTTIIVDKKNDKFQSSQPEEIEKYDLMELVSEFKQPLNKRTRYLAFVSLLFNPVLLWYYIKYCLSKGKISLDYIFILKFYKKIKQVKIYHVHFATALKPVLDLKKIGFVKAKIIVTFHGYDAHFLPQKDNLIRLLSDYKKYIEHITVNSNYLKTKLINKGFLDDKIKIIPIGVDTEVFKCDSEKKEFANELRLITVGRLIPLKGHVYGIKAVKRLVDKGEKVTYTIIGKGEEHNILENLISELNLKGIVTLLGAKNQLEIKEALVNHDVFLMTSTFDKDNRREAFGLVSLEAQAMGLPIVGFNSGGFPETIINGKTGFLVPDRDVNTMVNKIEYIINNPNVLSAMSMDCIKHIKENHKVNKMSNAYLKLYS